eukprot:m.93648 g.93648  ORF g.93648 m.93648 type:complete len:80 (+) comp14708_c0_seq3:70-309(+)
MHPQLSCMFGASQQLDSPFLLFFLPSLGIRISKEEDDLYRLEQSDAAFWVQVILSWITWGLLTWAAVAPCCFPDREFSR